MGSTIWASIAIIAVTAILVRGVVSIIAVYKSSGDKNTEQVDDLESLVDKLEQDLQDARSRIEVLEKIVTDKRFDLRQQIDDLAAG